MRITFFLVQVLLLSFTCGLKAQRADILLNKDWAFRFSHQVNKGSEIRVDIPHTWNAQDALSGKIDYKRGIGNYEKQLFIKEEWKGKRLFLRFEGVNTIANLFINRKHLGEHRGGYGAFIFEITDEVVYNKNNSIMVRVNNAEQLDIMPLLGDFNFYGGIYRDVHLLITDETCISPLDYASPGVYLIQESVKDDLAKVTAKVNLTSKGKAKEVDLRLVVKEESKVIIEDSKKIQLANTDLQEQFSFSIPNPHLWDGQKDPFMYNVEVSIIIDDKVIDQVKQPLGLRYYHTDPDKGFFLNGKHLQLKGVCRHQDRAEKGNALSLEHHQEDVDLMLDMGVNAVRLAHYPQSTAMHDLMDKYGFVVWAEIPFVGPGGYDDKGFVDQVSFKENGKTQLKELIRQHYNHPSICFWGIFNELKEFGDNPLEYVKDLNELSKQEDPTRPTTSASNQNGDLNFITDNIAWNKYDGWYGGMPSDLGKWLDNTHKTYPNIRIGISEYGAGASIYHQQDSLVKSVATSRWHPENWQTHYHIENWKMISERPYLWGTFVWNMFDFGAAHRTEGDRNGINDKGLVTFDRKTKKDSYYFYKANWNKKDPLLYLAEKRSVQRTKTKQVFTAYSNLNGNVELLINGKSQGLASPNHLSIVQWENIELDKGKNVVQVISKEQPYLEDSVILFMQ